MTKEELENIVTEQHKQIEVLLNERNTLALEVSHLQAAAGLLANIYDACLEQKSKAWCKHWQCIPLHMLHDVKFTMPTLEQCHNAKIALEC